MIIGEWVKKVQYLWKIVHYFPTVNAVSPNEMFTISQQQITTKHVPFAQFLWYIVCEHIREMGSLAEN